MTAVLNSKDLHGHQTPGGDRQSTGSPRTQSYTRIATSRRRAVSTSPPPTTPRRSACPPRRAEHAAHPLRSARRAPTGARLGQHRQSRARSYDRAPAGRILPRPLGAGMPPESRLRTAGHAGVRGHRGKAALRPATATQRRPLVAFEPTATQRAVLGSHELRAASSVKLDPGSTALAGRLQLGPAFTDVIQPPPAPAPSGCGPPRRPRSGGPPGPVPPAPDDAVGGCLQARAKASPAKKGPRAERSSSCRARRGLPSRQRVAAPPPIA